MRIVLVDVEGGFEPALRRAFRALRHEVSTQPGVLEAATYAVTHEVDVIVLAVDTPGTHEIEMAAHLAERDDWLPLFVIARNGDPSDVIRGLDAGADEFLRSPVSVGEVAARLRALRRRRTALATEALTVGDLRLDATAYRVWRAQREIQLSVREFTMLRVFMRNSGQALSRDFLREQVWDHAYRGTSNVVDQLVAQLRAKIDKPFGTHSLQTVRGLGYRLDTA